MNTFERIYEVVKSIPKARSDRIDLEKYSIKI